VHETIGGCVLRDDFGLGRSIAMQANQSQSAPISANMEM